MAIASLSSTSAFAAYDKITPAKRPVISENGERRYLVGLNPLYTTTLEAEARSHGFIRPELTDESFRIGNEEIEEPTVRYLAHALAAKIGKKPLKIYSWTGHEFHVDAKPEAMKMLLGQKGITGISEIDAEFYEEKLVFSQATGDIYSGSEIIPWWKQYTNTND